METTIALQNTSPAEALVRHEQSVQKPNASLQRVKGLEKWLLWAAIKLRIFYFACVVVKKPSLIRRLFHEMVAMRNNVWGGDLKKLYKVDGKYYFNLYTPGWPSKGYDALIKSELKRRASPHAEKQNLSFVHLAITRKCPLRCEH
jgi:hypothetical protein